MIKGMENPLHHLENTGEVVSMEQARTVLMEIKQELDAALSEHVSSTQVATLRRILAN